MKTPKEYAEDLIDKYCNAIGHNLDNIGTMIKESCLIDVQNTIDAIETATEVLVFGGAVISYYQEVKQILKEK